MKITAIESLQWAEFPRLMVVRVHTDSGIIGVGETVDKIPGAKGALHGTLAPLILGQEALDIEGLWRFVMDNIMYHGFAGAETRALSAVEVALWDIMGKFYNAPLVHLLGGKTRQHVPTYNTCIGHGAVQDYAAWQHDRDAGELARSLLADGIKAMKIWPFDRFSEGSFGQYISQKDVEAGLKPVRDIRQAVGDDMEIGIECHFRWNRASIERIARALEPYNILFMEDVMPAVYADEIKLFSARTSIPVIGSELLMTRWQLREWMEKHVAQILMTDPVWNGGISETKKIASMAEAYGLPLVLHNVAGPFCHAACMHLGANIPNLYFVESVRAFYRSYFETIAGWSPTVGESGLDIPMGPGLGVDLRPEMLERADLTRQVSEGPGLAGGRRAMGDHWAVEKLR
ncbi:MAG: mandelate racemase/muconate lactonizing enzyme family protein [Pleurocapsa minor GSE-CHR-MK-17-07R]|jgi:L-alanine-DL-glutamate epimerase-like enolase superfamily enzyme|nr:mandelate racemase/muconate lactonizing enzyme family protein [Pleurocapsa minor GSE-CHR-MK 17-07R]